MDAIRGTNKYNFKCAAFYYGLMISESKKYLKEIQNLANLYGFQLYEIDSIAPFEPGIPLFIVKSGSDQIPYINESMNEVIMEASKSNIPFTYINYSSGHHAFDINDDNEESKRIIQKTIEFFKENLVKIH